jgi:hypothetical protein
VSCRACSRGETTFRARTCFAHGGKVVIGRLRSRRRAKARDFASPASLASLIVRNLCQQMICVGDAKRETARGSRPAFRVTNLSLCVARTMFRDGFDWATMRFCLPRGRVLSPVALTKR